MQKKTGRLEIFDECYKCDKTFDIYEMYVYNSKNICVPCYEKFGIYYEVTTESKKKEKYLYEHIPRHIRDYTLSARDPDKWPRE